MNVWGAMKMKDECVCEWVSEWMCMRCVSVCEREHTHIL